MDRRGEPRPDSAGRRDGDRNGWSVEFIAKSIGMSVHFVRDELRRGELVGTKFGKSWRVTTRNLLIYYSKNHWPVPESVRDALKMTG